MEDYSNQNGHSGYDPKYNPQSYGPNYDYGSYGNDPYGEGGPNKSVKGLKIMIVIMALILAALSAIYFLQVKQMKDDFAIERDTLTRQLTSLMNDYDTLKTMNDTLAVHYEGVKHQADSLLDKLQKERRLSYSKIRNYEKQMSYMRTVMEGYIRQIDSLDRINKKLVNENTTIRKMITTYKLRAETAEEKSQELSTKVRQGYPSAGAEQVRPRSVAREPRGTPESRSGAGRQRTGRARRADGVRADHRSGRLCAGQREQRAVRFRGR